MNIWEQIKSIISRKISTEAYQNWLSKTVFLKTEGAKLWVACPGRSHEGLDSAGVLSGRSGPRFES